jgi:hypothetical protein
MAKIVFEGWEHGMRKIPFTKLLNEKAGLSLIEAKKIKDRLVDENQVIEIEVDNINIAKIIVEEAQNLKVRSRLKE